MRLYKSIPWLAGLLMMALGASGHAADIAYYANTNPTNFDGYLSLGGNQFWNATIENGPAVGTGVMDGTNLAWQVNSGAAHEERWNIIPTASDVARGMTNSWTMTTRLRLPSTSDGVDGAIELGYGDGNNLWRLRFGTDGDGDPMVQIFDSITNPTFTLQGAGNIDYHVYTLRYDPVSINVDLFVDGIERISNSPGNGLSLVNFQFGDATSGFGGNALWNSVELDLPEPTTAALVGLAGLLFARARRSL